MVGYPLPVALISELVASYRQVTAVNTSDPDLAHLRESFFDALARNFNTPQAQREFPLRRQPA